MTRALIKYIIEVNTMTSAYGKHLGLQTWQKNVKAHTIDASSLKTFGIVFASFKIVDKLGGVEFF